MMYFKRFIVVVEMCLFTLYCGKDHTKQYCATKNNMRSVFQLMAYYLY